MDLEVLTLGLCMGEWNSNIVNFVWLLIQHSFNRSTFKDHDIIYLNEAKKLLKHEKFDVNRTTVVYTHGNEDLP